MGDKNQPQIIGAMRRLHYGPGPHPGTGTDQDVHGNGNGHEFADSPEFEDGKLPLEGTKASVLTSILLTHFRGREEGPDWVNVEVIEVTLDEDNQWVTVEILSGPDMGEEDDVSIDEWIAYAADFDENLVPSIDPEERAIEIFGLTDDYREAGYIMASGDLLDFSGKNQGGLPGMRSIDHRDIWQAFPDNYEFSVGSEGSNWGAMVEFMALGNIRMHFGMSRGTHGVIFDIAKLPTSAQKRVMRDMAEGASQLTWDITDPETGSEIASGGGSYPEEHELAEMFEAAVRKLVGRSFEFQYFTLRIRGEQPSHRIDARDIDYGWAGKFKDKGVFTTPIEPTDGIIALPKAARGLSLEEPVSPDVESEPESENEIEEEKEKMEKKSLISDIRRSFTELMAAIRRER